MQYISFYKNRLPFKPKTNVVIYFDVTGIGMKRYYGVISEYYDRIVEEFRRGGLEFCFLPKIADDMDLEKIYRYFNPQADPNDFIPHINLYKDSDLLEYIVAGYNARYLLKFQKIGWNYWKASVIICVVIPIIIYTALILLIVT